MFKIYNIIWNVFILMYNRFMNEELQKGEIIIYTSEDGSI